MKMFPSSIMAPKVDPVLALHHHLATISARERIDPCDDPPPPRRAAVGAAVGLGSGVCGGLVYRSTVALYEPKHLIRQILWVTDIQQDMVEE